MISQDTVITIPKTCFRCGVEFRTQAGNRVCPSCRKPVGKRRGFASRDLTIRERQIVGLVRTGAANKEIGYQLHLTEGTIKEYLCRIFQKVGVTNRTELAFWSFTHHTESKGQSHA